MIVPEPVVTGTDLPLRPRCFRCFAVRADYAAGNQQRFTVIGGSRDCEHAWTDSIDMTPEEAS